MSPDNAAARAARYFFLFAKHRGGWDDLSVARTRHHETVSRWKEFGFRAWWSTHVPLCSPHPLVSRYGR